MLFNSFEYIFVFLPITFLLYFYLNTKRLTEASKGLLVFSSLFFYSWWNIIYLPLLLTSMLFNYVVGETLTKKSEQRFVSKKSILLIGILANISLLGYFKYADFFIKNVNMISGANIPLLHLALPLAISFFTFQQIAYLVDSYRGETHDYNFLNYAVFVSFFPQLIAGPIVHHKEMMPQFANMRNKIIHERNIAAGLFIFSIGLFKKVVIADTFAVWATAGFDTAQTLNFFEAWVTSLSYTFQLYYDFSGYTDMAVGASLLFNIRLPINFNSPYKAKNIQDFWRRWHITLSRFLKDYIYIPLGGSRQGHFRTYSNLMATFVIGGLWHGAGWTFVFWGFLHGIALVVHRLWQNLGFRMNSFLAWFITFNFINITWVFFRAKDWNSALKVLGAMFDIHHIVLPDSLAQRWGFLTQFGVGFGAWLEGISGTQWSMIGIMAAMILVTTFKNSMEMLHTFRPSLQSVLLASLLFAGGIISLRKVSEFLYFNF